jgi:hypothetical protein
MNCLLQMSFKRFISRLRRILINVTETLVIWILCTQWSGTNTSLYRPDYINLMFILIPSLKIKIYCVSDFWKRKSFNDCTINKSSWFVCLFDDV